MSEETVWTSSVTRAQLSQTFLLRKPRQSNHRLARQRIQDPRRIPFRRQCSQAPNLQGRSVRLRSQHRKIRQALQRLQRSVLGGVVG